MPATLTHRTFSSIFISQKIKIKVYRNRNLSLVSYCRGTGSVELRKEERLRAFLNCVLKNIFGTKGEEVTKLHNE
jgi:hypothetical protein